MRTLVTLFVVAMVGAGIALQAHTIPGFEHQHETDSALSKPMLRNGPRDESKTAFEFDGFKSGMTSAEIHQRMTAVSEKAPTYNEENGLFTAISLSGRHPIRRYIFEYTPEDPPRMYRMTIVISEPRSVPSIPKGSKIARRATLNALITKFDSCTRDSSGHECELKDDELEAEAERKIYEAVLNEISLPVIRR
tara:strand:- start:102 stop:680 length:579 start_codon:yes stop_codon:yes gene_type:complete